MRKTLLLTFLCSLCLASACRTVKIDTPVTKTVHPKPTILQAKQSLATKKLSNSDIPPVLGGLVKSDSWVIYKDKQQEEFVGNVSYDNGAYIFRADYALSERAKNMFSARGNVFLRQNNPDGVFYEVHAARGFYNYNTQTGQLYGNKKEPVRLIYYDGKGQTVTATAKQAQFNLNERSYILSGDAYILRETKEETLTVTAQKVTLKQFQNYALLEGGATLSDTKRTLSADTIEYDGEHNSAVAYGQRPLLQGETEQGTFAVIADQVQSDKDGQQINLSGKVQGWIVSPEINDSKINTKF